MPTNVELEKKLQSLELTVYDLKNKLDDTVSKLDSTSLLASNASKDIFALSVKIDGIREDLKEIKRLGEVIVPRVELESRLEYKHMRLLEVESAVTKISEELKQAQLMLAEKLHKNTVVAYWTLITILSSVLGAAVAAFLGKM